MNFYRNCPSKEVHSGVPFAICARPFVWVKRGVTGAPVEIKQRAEGEVDKAEAENLTTRTKERSESLVRSN